MDDYQPLGGGGEKDRGSIPPSLLHFALYPDPPDDDMEAGFEGAFDGFNQSGGQVNNPYMGVEPMGKSQNIPSTVEGLY